jgi:hypothetical protein
MAMEYESTVTVPSQICPGVSFRIFRMSFGRRVELMRNIRKLTGQLEFHDSGLTDADKMDASLLSAEIDRLYLVWGLRAVEGLLIDGTEASPESLASNGPEEVFCEALLAVKSQCGLSEAERKN